MKNKIIIKVLSCILLIFAGGCTVNKMGNNPQEKLVAAENKPNIILVTISSLRKDHVSCLGYDRQTTPNFDEFAQSGILFSNAFATSSWQMPAMGSIFTSMYPTDHGATHISNKLNANVQTLASVLKKNSYYTAGFGCNPRLTSEYGFDNGFDFYDDYSVSMMLSSMSFGQEDSINVDKKRTNDLVNDAVVRWLANNTHKPFFLSVHYYDPHWDYLPAEPFNTLFDPDYTGAIDGYEIGREPLYSNRPSDKDVEHIIALYDGEIKQTDNDLGELLSTLKQQGRFEDSLIIVMGDHGEQFYEHGHTSHHGLFDELIRIPLAISVPDSNSPKEITSFASGIDIMPTALDYAGSKVPEQCKGQSLKGLIEGKYDKERDFVFVEYTGGAVPDCFAARFDKYKFVCQEGDIFAYDLTTDPNEQRKINKAGFTPEMNELFEKIRHLIVRAKPITENKCKAQPTKN